MNIFSQFISYNVTYSTSDCHFSGSMCDFKETDCHVSRIANLWKQHYAIISFSYPRHQRFNEFILLFIFVNVSLRLLNVSPYFIHCIPIVRILLYTFGNYWNNYSYFLGKKANHWNFNKKPSIIVKFWGLWHYFIHFWQAFKLAYIHWPVFMYKC